MYYFNPDNFGFYLEPSKGLIEITDDQYHDLMNGQSEGNSIVIGDDGVPTLKPVKVTKEEALSAATSKRDSLLSVAAVRIAPLQDAVDLDDSTPEDVALLKLWKQYRVSVNRVTDQPGYPGTVTWPAPPDE